MLIFTQFMNWHLNLTIFSQLQLLQDNYKYFPTVSFTLMIYYFEFLIKQSIFITSGMNLNRKGPEQNASSSSPIHPLEKASPNNKKGLQRPRKSEEQETKGSASIPKKVYKSRSIKKEPNSLDISFEGSILDGHQEVFQEEFKNLIESTLKNAQIQALESCLSKTFIMPMQISGVLKLQNHLLFESRSQQFEEDLKLEPKLREFLEFISQTVPKRILDQLIYIASQCWEKYLQIRNPFLDPISLLKISKEFVKNLMKNEFQGNKIRFLSFSGVQKSKLKDSKNVKKNVQRFIEAYCGTVFFVIEEYFQNPYLEGNQLDRKNLQIDSIMWDDFEQAFEDEEDQQGKPYKKIKLN